VSTAKIYVHIGMQKAGSTAFQKTIAANAPHLAAAGLVWPSSGRAGTWHLPLLEDEGLRFVEPLKSELAGAKGAVISYEGGYLAPDAVISGLASAGRLNPLMLAREPVGWLNSFFNQLIKAHRVPWGEIRDFDIDAPRSSRALAIEPHVERWARRCDKPDDFLVIEYERAIRFSDVFRRWTGHSLLSGGVSENPNPAADVSSLRVLAMIKRELAGADASTLFRAMTLAHARLNESWVDTRTTQAAMFLTEAEQQSVLTRYAPGFRRVFEKFGDGPPRESCFVVRPQTHSRSSLFNCSEDERALAEEILNTAA